MHIHAAPAGRPHLYLPPLPHLCTSVLKEWVPATSDSILSCQNPSKGSLAGSLVGYGQEDPPAGSGSLAPSWARGDEMRLRLRRTFRDKGLTSSSSQAGNPAGSCLRGRWAALARGCVRPRPWECCVSASQVRRVTWGLEVGEGRTLPPGVLQSLSVQQGQGGFCHTSPNLPRTCPCSFPPPGYHRQLIGHFLASTSSSRKWSCEH